ncbi:hypothetical protein [Paracoccus liaowanqingii]|nr:hypothetical protein [Paracoccus liaowanqingii]
MTHSRRRLYGVGRYPGKMINLIRALVASSLLIPTLASDEANAWTREQFIIAPNLIKQEMLRPDAHVPLVWNLAGQLAYHEGFGSSHIERRGSQWDLTPIISYDRNINNGFAQDTLVIGGLEFSVDEEFRRKSAPIVGASLYGRHVWGLTPKVAFALNHATRYVHAWNANYAKWSLRVQPCLTYFLSSTSRAFACGSVGRWATSLSRQDEAYIDIGTEFAYNLGTYFQSSRMTLRKTAASNSRDYQQISAAYRHQILMGDATLISAQIDLLEEVESTFVPRERIQVSATKLINMRKIEVGYVEDIRRGGVFLGEPRKETLRGVFISAQLAKGIEVRIGGFWNKASNAINDDEYAVLDFTFDLFAR